MARTAYLILLSLLLIAVHTVLVPFLAILDITPDILLLWVVYIAVREGQMPATAAGFLIGLVADLVAGDAVLGLSSLSKTLAGFIAGYFHNENKTLQTLGSYTFLIIVALAALLHNTIYFTIFLQGTSPGVAVTLLRYGLPAAAYTVAVGLLPMFAFARRMLT
jgi:rod shape-determining protein MreD